MTEILTSDQEKQVKKLKRKLEGWREAIIPIHSVLLWEKKWYPGLIVGAISAVYFTIWVFDPPLLTMFAGFGVMLTLLDFLVPVLISHLYAANSWTKNKEKLFEEICRSVVIYYNCIYYSTESFYKMRQSVPWMYYSVMLGALSTLAWIGATRDNLVLTYLWCVGFCLLPGILSNATVSMYMNRLINTVSDYLKRQGKTH